MWYGPNKGAGLASLATPGNPFFVAPTWVKYFVTQNPSFDATKINYKSFEQLFRSSQKQFNDIVGTDDPSLSAFAKSGHPGLIDTLTGCGGVPQPGLGSIPGARECLPNTDSGLKPP